MWLLNSNFEPHIDSYAVMNKCYHKRVITLLGQPIAFWINDEGDMITKKADEPSATKFVLEMNTFSNCLKQMGSTISADALLNQLQERSKVVLARQ